jgi:hypothetical protein
LVGDFTTISSSTSGDTSAANAGQIGLTVVTSTASRLAAGIVSAHERSFAKAKRDVALGLARDHTSVESTTIGIRKTSTARTISLTVGSSGSSTICVLGARTTDTGAYITNLLSRGFTTIEGTAVGVGSASKAGLVSLTVATGLANTAGVVCTEEWVNADTSTNAALYLSSLFTTIKGTAVSIGSTFDARTISLTVGEIQSSKRTAISIGCALFTSTRGGIANRGGRKSSSALGVDSTRNTSTSKVYIIGTTSISHVGLVHANGSSSRANGSAVDGTRSTLSLGKGPSTGEGGNQRSLITTLASTRGGNRGTNAIFSEVVGRCSSFVREIGSISRLGSVTRVSVTAEIVVVVRGSSSSYDSATIALAFGITSRDQTIREISVTKAILVFFATTSTSSETQSTRRSRRALWGVESSHIKRASSLSLLGGVDVSEAINSKGLPGNVLVINDELPGGGTSLASHRDDEFSSGGDEAFTVSRPSMAASIEDTGDPFHGNERIFISLNQKVEGTHTAMRKRYGQSRSIRGLFNSFIHYERIVEGTVDNDIFAISQRTRKEYE